MINSRPHLPVLMLVLLLLIPTAALNAQWPAAGVQLTNRNIQTTYYEPDSSGGIWVIYEDYEFLSPRPMVQHIDSDGNKLLGPEGMFVLEDTTAFGYIYGIQPLSDGGAFAVYDIYEENYVHAQRFSATGEKLLDEAATKVSTNDDFSAFRGFLNSNVCSDGADGFWVVFTQALSFDLYFAGMNSDGSLKTGMQFITTENDDYGTICEDGTGGFLLFTNCPLNETYESVFYNHFDAEGTPVYTGRGIRVFSGLDYPLTKIRVLPSPEGGVIVAGGRIEGIAWYQRISPADTMMWGSAGIYYNVAASLYTITPAIKSDGSILFASTTRAAYDYKIRVGWISSEGAEKVSFVNNVVWSGNSSYLFATPAILNLHIDNDDIPLLFLRRTAYTDSTGLTYHYTVHRIDDTGTHDLWANDSYRVCGMLPGSDLYGIFVHEINDNKPLVAIRYGHPTTNHICFNFYKLDITSYLGGIPEENPGNSILPDRIEIVSTYPNPFNSSVTVTLRLPSARPFNIEVYDIMGRRVDTIQQGATQAGTSKIIWSPGSSLSSGIYFFQIKQGYETATTKKVVLLR